MSVNGLGNTSGLYQPKMDPNTFAKKFAEENNVSFEVLDNEIIVFYFTDHYHFEDYSSELEEGEDDYIKRAKDFLIELFENQIKGDLLWILSKKLSV